MNLFKVWPAYSMFIQSRHSNQPNIRWPDISTFIIYINVADFHSSINYISVKQLNSDAGCTKQNVHSTFLLTKKIF